MAPLVACGEVVLAVVSPADMACKLLLVAASKAERNGLLETGLALFVAGVGSDAGELIAGEFARFRKGLLELKFNTRGAGGEARRSVDVEGTLSVFML